MLAAVADGTSQISGLLHSEDVLATIRAFRQMGVEINEVADGLVTVKGVGPAGLKRPHADVDLGNSGTALRLLTGLLAGHNVEATLTGDESLRKRPMQRIEEPLNQMGARVAASGSGVPPVHIRQSKQLRGIHYCMPVASAQVKSTVLLAGMYASGETCIDEPAVTRDHTERMMATFGYPCRHQHNRVCLDGGGTLQGTDIDVPGDLSSAAFFIVGAAICRGSHISIQGVGVNPTRSGVLTVMRRMGARIEIENQRNAGNEPVADINVRHAPLKGIEIPPELVSLGIDEFPIIAIAAACAEGNTVVRGAQELRHKESDRIRAIVSGLKDIGVQVEERDDGMLISGGVVTGGRVDSCGDHRIAMAFCMAALRSIEPIVVHDCDNIATSFPDFSTLAQNVGLDIRQA
jgi:3-phosphoshikimate 1-carboxyvinyltransferase